MPRLSARAPATALRQRRRALLRRARQRTLPWGPGSHLLFEQALDPVLVYPLGADGRPLPFVAANEAAVRLYGYPREELRRMTCLDLLAPESPADEAALEELERTGTRRCATVHRTRDGRRIPVETTSHRFVHRGRPMVLAVSRDLTVQRRAEEAAALEARLAEIVGRVSDDVLILDRAWRILYLNPAAVRAIGPAAEGAVGRVFWEAFPQLLGTEAERYYRHAMAAREPVTFETLGALTGRYVEVRIYPTADGLIVLGRDFSERERATARLRRESERLRALAAASLAATRAEGLAAKLQAVAEGAREVARAAHAAVRLAPPEPATFDLPVVATAGEAPAAHDAERRLATARAGRPARTSDTAGEAWLAVPLLGSDGRPLGLLEVAGRAEDAFSEDDEAALVQLAQLASAAVEAERAEAARLDAAERFRFIVEQAAVGVGQGNLRGQLTYANDRLCELLGYSAEELYRLHLRDITHPDDVEASLAHVRRLAETGEPFTLEKRYLRKDGDVVWAVTTVRPLLDAEGRPFASLLVVVDVTERRRQEEALRTSETRFRLLAEAMPQKVFTADPRGGVTYYNERWAHYTGLGEQDLLGDAWHRIVHPDDLAPSVRAWRKAVETAAPFEIEQRFLRHDGAWRWHLSRALPLCDDAGRVTMWVGANTDVHDLKTTQERLRFLLALDAATRTTDDPNEAMARVVRLLAEHLEAHRCLYAEVHADEDHLTVLGNHTRATFDLVGELRISDFGKEALRLLRAGEPYVVEDAAADPRITARDLPAYRRIEVAAAVCVPLLKGGRLVGVVAVHQTTPRRWTPDEVELVRAVTSRAWEALARARALRALTESEARYRALAELAPQIVYTAQPDGTVDYVNQRWYDYTGWDPDTPLADWTRAVHPDQRAQAHEAFLEAVRTGTDYEQELLLRRADGTYRWHLDRARPIRDAAGAIVRWIGVAVDVHDRIEARAQLEALNATLEARVAERTALAEGQARQLRRLAAELTRAEQKERRRLATMLHDHLQQLLAAAQFHLQLVEAAAPSTPSTGRVRELLQQALDVSRSLTAQLSPPVLHDGGLAPALEWLARWMEEHHGLSVALDLDPAAEPEDEHVRVVLFEAAREVLFNVVKHAGVREASVSLHAESITTVLTVEDRGVGFSPSPPPSPDAPLKGLGLPSVRERMGYVGGILDLSSHPGHGTRVTLTAPRTATLLSSLQPRYATDRAASAPEDTPPAKPRRLRVLLVDDHEILRAGLSSLLAAEDGIEIVGEAADGIEAVDLALTLRPDVVVMDITMPRMNGIEATRRITEKLPGVRVVGLSMHAREDMARALREAGAATYVEKGGPPQALIAAVRGDA